MLVINAANHWSRRLRHRRNRDNGATVTSPDSVHADPAVDGAGDVNARKPRVAVVFGGQSSEHSISCLSAASILHALDPADYDIVAVGVDRDGRWSLQPDAPAGLLREAQVLPEVVTGSTEVLPVRGQSTPVSLLGAIDVVFPVLHGPFGEDGTIQGLLELAGVPYVGSGVLASAAAMDKAHCKALLAGHGINVARWHTVHARQFQADPDAVVRTLSDLSLPVFVKPARAGSSVGVSKVKAGEDLIAALETAFEHDPKVVVEEAIAPAREVEVGVLTGTDGAAQASVPAEIVMRGSHEFYDFDAKYLDDAADLIVPAELSSQITSRVRALACEVFDILGCEGLARVDMFVKPDGDVVVNEVNTMPGFTSISLFPRMWQQSGVSYPMLVDHLVQDALRRGVGLR